MMDHDHDDNYHLRSKALDKAEAAGSFKAVEEMLQGAHLVLGFYTGSTNPVIVEKDDPLPVEVAPGASTAATNVVDFPLVDDAIAAAAEPARKERKPRGPNKLKAAKGKRGRPAKTADTGDAPGDAPATAPVANGAVPHIDPPHEVDQSPMAA